MNKRDPKTKVPLIETLESAAERGSLGALKILAEAPECPQEFMYLVEWAQSLHGRSGVGATTVALLSHQEVMAWQSLTRIGELHPWEVEALMLLDAALFGPDEDDEESVEELPERPWPKRKNGA